MHPVRQLPAPARRTLGPQGPGVSPLAWGMWRFRGDDTAQAQALVEAALITGINLFDTADIYGADTPAGFGSAEELLGKVLRHAPHLRQEMVLATKGGIIIGTPYDSSATYVAAAIDASLRRLGVDHVELWQVHRPDLLTHPQELARALEDAVVSGKVGAVGVSNFTPAQVAALSHYLTVPLVSLQPEFSPLQLLPLENGLLDQAMQQNLTVLAWSPLGQGRVAAPASTRELAVAAALDVHAAAYGVSRTAAAYSWIMAHPAGAIPIVGSQQVPRIREAADALKVRWTRAEWYEVLVASRQERLP